MVREVRMPWWWGWWRGGWSRGESQEIAHGTARTGVDGAFKDAWARDLETFMRRDRNHPSVILWSIGNEIFEALGSPIGAEWSQRQADYVRRATLAKGR